MFGIKPSRLTEAAGWYGMIALIVAYGLVSFSVIKGDGIEYQLLNLTGGLGLIVVAASKHVVQSVLLNIFWAAIGIIAIVRIVI
jgi:hypothetical protein